ncbi:hypothetical protein C882_4370 [Caenispirillum salinarum AK4]|uniref:Uncharacterized protein n=1 Tax=Caenispirillum salinarum AK4 TaxID=1238182 RepID=K9HPI1_9PROT|nr:hypothetical protein C882_4370 [Caenispirillum salinarum AK4]
MATQGHGSLLGSSGWVRRVRPGGRANALHHTSPALSSASG